MSDFQIVQQPVAQLHLQYNLSSFDVMKWNRGMSKITNSRVLADHLKILFSQLRELKVEIKKQLAGLKNA